MYFFHGIFVKIFTDYLTNTLFFTTYNNYVVNTKIIVT